MSPRNRLRIPFLLAALVLLVSACYTQQAPARSWTEEPWPTRGPTSGPIYPLAKQITLRVGDRTLKPVRVVSPWEYEYSMGARHFTLTGKQVQENDVEGKPIWSILSSEGPDLHWLTASDPLIYLTRGYDPSSKRPVTTLYRLDANARQWLQPIELPTTELPDKSIEIISAAQADGPSLFVLSLIVDEEDEETVTAYRVDAYSQDVQAPLWSRTFEWAGEREEAGVYLMASREPDVTVIAPQALTPMGESLVVCAGGRQDLVSLNRSTGEEEWRVERIWEYERGFIGPSVWSHFIDRFGRDWDWEGTEGELAKARKEFDEQFSCAIVGGPVAVPRPAPINSRYSEEAGYNLFVAVARSGQNELTGYLDECIVYELYVDQEGAYPISMATLPRMIRSPDWQPMADGVVWGGQRGSMVKLQIASYSPYEASPSMGGNLAGTDLVTDIEWYRQPSPERIDAWITADPANDPIAFGDRYAFRPLGGGYVVSAGDSVYHFRLAMIDLQEGTVQTLLLNVPYSGQVTAPVENYIGWDEQHFQSKGPYLLGVTWLEVRGTALRVVLGTEGEATAVDFELGDALQP